MKELNQSPTWMVAWKRSKINKYWFAVYYAKERKMELNIYLLTDSYPLPWKLPEIALLSWEWVSLQQMFLSCLGSVASVVLQDLLCCSCLLHAAGFCSASVPSAAIVHPPHPHLQLEPNQWLQTSGCSHWFHYRRVIPGIIHACLNVQTRSLYTLNSLIKLYTCK